MDAFIPFSVRNLLLTLFAGGLLTAGIYAVGRAGEVSYDPKQSGAASSTATSTTPTKKPSATGLNQVPEIIVTHVATPVPLKAIYMTSCIASGKGLRSSLVKFIDSTELNAVVIDIKDFTGMISFDAADPNFIANTNGCFVEDMKAFIAELHEKNIYVIGRVTVMQDTVYPKTHPDAAVKRRSSGAVWKDKKGLTFIDPGATEYWQHMVELGKDSYAAGFDEINYDYIRFPSDGDMSDIAFTRTGSTTKAAMMKKFYTYLGKELHAAGVTISADLFGMTTTNTDDLGIGQVLENALLNFDYVAPMVYPSHYPPMFNGWKDPNLYPYEVVKFSMTRAVERANALEEKEFAPKASSTISMNGTSTVATSTQKYVATGIYAKRLRPWIQDFNYGKIYTEADVRLQKKAVYDSGLTSWMMWDPANHYTRSAFDGD